MTEPETQRTPYLRYLGIGVAALVVVVAIVLIVRALSGPDPIDWKVTVTGVGTTGWTSPEGSGQIGLTAGSGTQVVHASKLTVTVSSTAADGATCQITDPGGRVVDDQRSRGGTGLISVTCSTEK